MQIDPAKYKHLLVENDPLPFEQREPGKYVVAWWPRTGVVRLFLNLLSPGEWYSHGIYQTEVYTHWSQLAVKHSDSVMKLQYHRLTGKLPAGNTTREIAQQLWTAFQKHGSLVRRERPYMEVVGHKDATKYQVNLPLLLSAEAKEIIAGKPKQERVVAEALIAEKRTAYAEKELEDLAWKLVREGTLKTKQDPFRIVRYYLPDLAKHGFVEYPTRRVHAEDSDEEEAA